MVRGLLTDDERRLLFAIPADQETLIQHYTLAPDEIELTLGKRGARNRLGLALQLCLLRHPGFGLSAAENVPDELLRYLGAQLGVPALVYLD
jgi:TnpA family transposase